MLTGDVDRLGQVRIFCSFSRDRETDWWSCLCRYQSVLSACCLRPDLALLPSADLTEVTSLPVCL